MLLLRSNSAFRTSSLCWLCASTAHAHAAIADADSDLDIFIELENVTPSLRRQISEIAWEVGLEMDRMISTLVATRAQVAYGAIGANPIMRHVATDGVSL